jgi:hypothetical protein
MAVITDVEIVSDRTVELTFADGSTRVVDLEPFLWGPVFDAIAKDDAVFAKVAVDPELGTITWPNGVDLDPDVLHGDYDATQPWKRPHH